MRRTHANVRTLATPRGLSCQLRAAGFLPESRERRFLTRPSHRFVSPLRTAAPCGLPAHRLGDCAGRSPGSRVVICVRPSRFPSGLIPTRTRRLQLRGQPRTDVVRRLPCSLLPPRSLGEPARCKSFPGTDHESRHPGKDRAAASFRPQTVVFEHESVECDQITFARLGFPADTSG